MTITPYGFQQEAVDKFSDPKIVARLIGDDMGLGKTVTALALDRANRMAERAVGAKTLVLAPLAVTDSWRRHIGDMYPHARVVTIDPKNRAAFIKALKEPYDFYILHWEGCRILCQELQRVMWFHIIADEVHRVKNRKAQVTLSLKSLRTKYKTGLSGTPADDKPHDLWSILNWLWPKYYTSYWRFLKHYCIFQSEQNHGSGRSFQKFVGVQNAASLHREMSPWFIRRLKSEVLTDLPDKYYQDIWVDLHPQQRKAYEEMRRDMITWVDNHEHEPVAAPVAIAQLTRLQQFALGYMQGEEVQVYKQSIFPNGKGELVTKIRWHISDPSSKLDALMEIIADNPGKQLVVFSQFKSVLILLCRRLTAKGIPHGLYTGDAKKSERDQIVQDFQAGKLQVFAGTIAAGGEGITLTAADTMVFLDRSWKPTANRQAEDRLHRIGQKNAVQIIDIMARETVDLGRRQKIQLKWELIREILGDNKR